jgi:hypothetical protein
LFSITGAKGRFVAGEVIGCLLCLHFRKHVSMPTRTALSTEPRDSTSAARAVSFECPRPSSEMRRSASSQPGGRRAVFQGVLFVCQSCSKQTFGPTSTPTNKGLVASPAQSIILTTIYYSYNNLLFLQQSIIREKLIRAGLMLTRTTTPIAAIDWR